MSSPVFGADYAGVYDALYENKQYEQEAAYVRGLLAAAGVAAGNIVELGSGTGIHGQLLARAGYRVHGVERSADMAASSERRAAASATPWSVVIGDARHTRLPGQWDGVLALFHVVSYQTSDEDLDQLLANVAAHLRPGAAFVFDVWHADAVLAIRPSTRVKRAQANGQKIIRVAESDLDARTSVVTVHYTVFAEGDGDLWRRTEEEHRMRYFTESEVRAACARHGLLVERAEEWLTGNAASASTWGVCYVARKTS
jgi:SAM-dependent methyltransferase